MIKTLAPVFPLLAVLIMATGCTIYKSDDRDSFDSNALAGAPSIKASVTHAICDRDASNAAVRANGLDLSAKPEDIVITHANELSRSLIARRGAGETVFALCQLEFAPNSRNEEITDLSREYIESFLATTPRSASSEPSP